MSDIFDDLRNALYGNVCQNHNDATSPGWLVSKTSKRHQKKNKLLVKMWKNGDPCIL
jgi:hypothetical protein